jgi:hypothetical protein
MDKGSLVLKTDIKALAGDLIKRFGTFLITLVICIIGNKLRKYVASKFDITDSIFKAELVGTVSMVLVYIVLGILVLLALIALYKFLALFYELKHTTTIDFEKGKIIMQSYDFPFDRHVEEKRFNRIVGVVVTQKSLDRMAGAGELCVEYLVQSKTDSKLRSIEVPYVLNPLRMKDKLLERDME